MDASTYRLYAHAALHTDALTLETRRIVGQTARVAGSRACCLSNTGCNELAGAALIFVTAVAVRMLLGPEHPCHWVMAPQPNNVGLHPVKFFSAWKESRGDGSS